MKEYLERTLHQPIELEPFTDTDRLPLIYRNSIRLYQVKLQGQTCLLIEPKEIMTLLELRRCHKQIERHTGQNCALYLHHMTYYAKDALLQEGIPFVWEEHQLYLPFLGLMLNPQEHRSLKPCGQISFLTQKLLLKALYEGWNGVSVSSAAEALQVTKTSITRCFDELEVLELPILKVKSRARKLYADPDRKAMWQLIRPVLRDPVLRSISLADPIDEKLTLSGITALAAYSMLEDDPVPTFAVEKARLQEAGARKWKQTAAEEQPACTVHEVGYMLPFDSHNAVDPLTLSMMLEDEAKADPRVEKAISEMLEEYVW